jgi:transcriptional regulator of acetoin/glycerol metabolism
MPAEITPEAFDAIKRHSWPGNVRELRNVLERAALLARGGPIELRHLELGEAGDVDLQALLRRNGGDKERTARELGISRATLYRRLSQTSLTREN